MVNAADIVAGGRAARSPGQKTRILFLQHTGIIGGAELHLLSLARHYRDTSSVLLFQDGPFRRELEREGVPVTVSAARWAGEGVRRGKPRLSPRGAFDVLRLGVLGGRLGRGADLLYANTPKALIVAAIAGPLARKPVVWYLHDRLDTTHFSSEAIRQSVAISNRIAALVLANSKDTAAAFVRVGGRAGSLHVVGYGIDPAPFTGASPDERAGVLRELGFEGRPMVGVFGRLTSWKGQHVVLEALARIPNVGALVVGDPREDPTYAAELERRARQLGVSDRVRFLGFRSDVPRLMQAVDVVVHSAVAPEPFGRVIVEGMLAGRPVIASAAGGVSEIVEEGVSGLLFPPGDSSALAAAISDLLQDPARSAEMGEAGRKRARILFSPARMLDETDRHLVETIRR